MRDRDVREALRRKVLGGHIRDPNTLVIEELGIAHGEIRIDVVVVNCRLQGFEIKSDADTLQRLPAQMVAYNAVFDRVTIIVGKKHFPRVCPLIPPWWGMKVALTGRRGAVHFEDARTAGPNPAIDPFSLASLLWKNEAITLLEARGERGLRTKNRTQLYSTLVDRLTLLDLRDAVRNALKTRAAWRSDAQQGQCADS